MAVVVDSGPVAASDKLERVPKEKWHDLMLARRYFMEVRLPYDCRCLVEFVEDTKEMYEACGFQSSDDMVRNGYNLEPDDIKAALVWLKDNEPEKAIGIAKVRSLAETARNQADPDSDEYVKQGRPSAGEKVYNVNHLGKGNSTDYTLRRLARERPDLLDKFESGEISANAAAIAAGFRVKTITVPLDPERAARALLKHFDRDELIAAMKNDR